MFKSFLGLAHFRFELFRDRLDCFLFIFYGQNKLNIN